jgi:hypothetical protein
LLKISGLLFILLFVTSFFYPDLGPSHIISSLFLRRNTRFEQLDDITQWRSQKCTDIPTRILASLTWFFFVKVVWF